MKDFIIEKTNIKNCPGPIKVTQWITGDDFPCLGTSVGIDTETELITDTVKDPNVVVLGCFVPNINTVYIVMWNDIPAFMNHIKLSGAEQRYFNVGFDQQVIDNETEDKPVMVSADLGYVKDMMIRISLHDIANIGFVMKTTQSLAGAAKRYLKIILDKGQDAEEGEEIVRLSFNRNNKDITEEQAYYLAFDCMTTWALGEVIPPMPTETTHTKGMIVLANIEKNGLCYDEDVKNSFLKDLETDKEVYRQELVSYGFPDPNKANIKISDVEKQYEDEIINDINYVLKDLNANINNIGVYNKFSSNLLRLIVCYLYLAEDDKKSTCNDIWYTLYALITRESSFKKKASDIYDEILDTTGLLAYDKQSRKAVILKAIVSLLIKDYRNRYDKDEPYKFEESLNLALEEVDTHDEWFNENKIGPRKFFQEYVQHMIDNNKDLVLDMTEKSNEYKLTKKDMWKLSDLNIEDKFLTSYVNYNHCVTYISTYFKDSFFKSDHRVHPRFNNVLKTGRTSCTRPNIQNLPSRDAKYPLKNMYVADPGMLLCATDFSFIELVCLSESCIQRFGFSVLGDIINAGVDPHGWFAGVRGGLISSSIDFTKDPKEVEAMSKFLSENISKSDRNNSKAANFGFGGGMSARSFYRNCREQGIHISMEEAFDLREKWIDTFTEMRLHFNPEEIKVQDSYKNNFYMNDINDEEDETEDTDESKIDNNRKLYKATLINGMVRTNCTYNSALNVQFQGLAAYGVKKALWNVSIHGYLPRLRNMIHDEILYVLYEDEIDEHVPYIEKLMIEGMRQATPHVKVKVETDIMRYWDKGAIPYSEYLVSRKIEDPEYVKKVKGTR